jgi:FkbM family methyltransferase
MLIPQDKVIESLKTHNIQVKGVLHIGAHECEELPFYHRLGLTDEQVLWIDAMPNKIIEALGRGITTIFQAIVTDKDDEPVKFNVSNNGQSSSVLEFGTHSAEHPHVHFVSSFEGKTTTIDTFFSKKSLNPEDYTFWNLDIQGAEYLALLGAKDSLKYANALYLEINEKELYVGCTLLPDLDAFLQEKGFTRVLTEMTIHGWGDALYVRTQV